MLLQSVKEQRITSYMLQFYNKECRITELNGAVTNFGRFKIGAAMRCAAKTTVCTTDYEQIVFLSIKSRKLNGCIIGRLASGFEYDFHFALRNTKV